MALSCGPKGRAPTAQAAGGAAAGGLGIWPQASTAPKGRAHARLSTNRSSKLLFNPTDIARPIRFRNAEAIPAIRPERLCRVVLRLTSNILPDGCDTRLAHGECRITVLPVKHRCRCVVLVDPP